MAVAHYPTRYSAIFITRQAVDKGCAVGEEQVAQLREHRLYRFVRSIHQTKGFLYRGGREASMMKEGVVEPAMLEEVRFGEGLTKEKALDTGCYREGIVLDA